jgi:hypothetical protein
MSRDHVCHCRVAPCALSEAREFRSTSRESDDAHAFRETISSDFSMSALVARHVLVAELDVQIQTMAKWERDGSFPEPEGRISDRLISAEV